jgi:UDP-N-acetylmuramoyl-tripeptide--D-alanyl-D-alanine ligase
MKQISAKALATRLKGEYFGDPVHVSGFSTDDREVRVGDAFIAIRGSRVDGHDFVRSAYSSGATLAIVERAVEGNHILVPNIVEALSAMAISFRQEFEGPVVGITGSAGKTITKEFVVAAVSPLGSVLSTDGNRNTEYTAPLVWPELTKSTAVAVMELSMRGKGQIAHLANFVRPTHSVITNIGWAHLEQLGSRQAIAEAKGEILQALPRDGIAVLWQEDEFFDSLRSLAWPRSVATFGYTERSDCRIIQCEAVNWSSSVIRGFYLNLPWEAEIPLIGRHLALNASAAITVAATVGIAPQEAAIQLFHAKIPPMRMEVVQKNGVTYVLDTYNASLPAMTAAIETFAEMPGSGRRHAVIGEMRELGAFAEPAHREIGAKLAEHGPSRVCFVGEAMIQFAAPEYQKSGGQAFVANSIEDVRTFLRSVEPGDHVLVKGSRALELERALQDEPEQA